MTGAPPTAEPFQPQDARLTPVWRREHAGSGLTSRLILAYAEREAGGQAVKRILERANLQDAEQRLRDENFWFSYETKLKLWEAAEFALEDRHVAEHVGAAVLDLSVAMGLKRTLRALGSPGFVYANVVRANAKFNWAHKLEVLSKDATSVRMRYTDLAGVGYHRYDCEYTGGLLTTVPNLFGLPAAHVSHRECGARSGACCEFDVRWTNGIHGMRRAALAIGTAGAALTGGSALLEPRLLPVTVGLLGAGELGVVATDDRVHASPDARARAAHRRAGRRRAAAALLARGPLLGPAPRRGARPDHHARADRRRRQGVRAAARRGRSRCAPTATPAYPRRRLDALAAWAEAHREAFCKRGTIVVDDLSSDALLSGIPRQAQAPFGSICAAPLLFRDGLLGVLVALSHGSTVFLPGDVAALSAYAAHAAIALSNARLVEQLQRQAAEDPLTALANQRTFYERCAIEFSRAQRSGSPISIVMLDLDLFKAINDEHGHLHGDRMLVAVADALRTATRGHDTVARMGGEEFAMLLPDTDAATAYELAERARETIALISNARGDAHLFSRRRDDGRRGVLADRPRRRRRHGAV